MTRERKESTKRQRLWEARALGFLDDIIAVEEEKRINAKAQLKAEEVDELQPA